MKKYTFLTLSIFTLVSMLLSIACTKTGSAPTPVTPVDTTPGNETSPINLTVSTIAGKAGERGNAEDGNGAAARFWNPTKMVYDPRNNTVYVADGTAIRSIDQQNNVKTYMPLGTISGFNEIQDIDLAPGAAGGTLYFISKENDIWQIAPNGNSIAATRIIDRVYGGNETGELNTADQIDGGYGIAAGANNEIYFVNAFWNTVHKASLSSLSPATGTVQPFAGKPTATRGGNAWPFSDGQAEAASFGGSVSDMASDGVGNLYIADFRNDLVRMITAGGMVSSLFQYKDGYGIDKDGPVSIAQANHVTQVSASQDGTAVFFTTYGLGGNNPPALRLVKPGKEVITLVGLGKNYGDGAGTTAGLSTIGGIAATPDGKTIYIAEPGKKVIRKVVLQ